jgi:hypothetical protein
MVNALKTIKSKCVYLDESISGDFEEITKYLANQVRIIAKIFVVKFDCKIYSLILR